MRCKHTHYSYTGVIFYRGDLRTLRLSQRVLGQTPAHCNPEQKDLHYTAAGTDARVNRNTDSQCQLSSTTFFKNIGRFLHPTLFNLNESSGGHHNLVVGDNGHLDCPLCPNSWLLLLPISLVTWSGWSYLFSLLFNCIHPLASNLSLVSLPKETGSIDFIVLCSLLFWGKYPSVCPLNLQDFKT